MRCVGVGVIALAASLLGTSAGWAADIRCKGIVETYQPLLDVTSKGINTVMDRFKALDKKAPESSKEALRKKYCAVGGEGMGLYRALLMQINACVAAGESMDALPTEVKGYLDQTEKAVTDICG